MNTAMHPILCLTTYKWGRKCWDRLFTVRLEKIQRCSVLQYSERHRSQSIRVNSMGDTRAAAKLTTRKKGKTDHVVWSVFPKNRTNFVVGKPVVAF